MQHLTEAVLRYVDFFKVPFPTMPIQDLSEGRVSRQVLYERIMQALSTQKADLEWEQMYPSPRSIEDLLYYQPMFKALRKTN